MNRWRGRPRKAWLASLAAALLLLALLAAGCGQSTSASSSLSPSASPSTGGYRVLEKSWSSPREHPYVIYDVLVPAGSSRRDLREIAAEVVAQAKRGKSFVYLWIFFYDYAELSEYAGPPLGRVRYGGTTIGRSQTEAGDYPEMVYTYRLTHRDWDRRPSQRDVTWWGYPKDLYWRAQRHGKEISEARLTRMTARHFGVSTAAVRAAEARVDAWVTPCAGRVW